MEIRREYDFALAKRRRALATIGPRVEIVLMGRLQWQSPHTNQPTKRDRIPAACRLPGDSGGLRAIVDVVPRRDVAMISLSDPEEAQRVLGEKLALDVELEIFRGEEVLGIFKVQTIARFVPHPETKSLRLETEYALENGEFVEKNLGELHKIVARSAG